MIKSRSIHIGKISLLLAVFVWLSLLFVDLVRLFGILNQLESGIAIEITWILQILFYLTVYGYYRYSIQNSPNKDFLSLIWRGASSGIFTVGVAFLIKLFYTVLGDSSLALDPFLKNFFYHVMFAFITVFVISNTLLWEHLILYQKNKRVVKQWQAFEIALLIAMFSVFFTHSEIDFSFLFGIVFLAGLSIFLAGNLKWIPYLTFKEKWKSLLFLSIIIVSGIYLFWQVYIANTLFAQVSLLTNLFLIGLFIFVVIYALFSFLVTLFNLPTSSVFEQKLTEAINFQRLSQSIQPEENEEQVLDILMDSCMSASYADSAWLELNMPDEDQNLIQERFILPEDRAEITKLIQENVAIHEWSLSQKSESLKPISVRLEHPSSLSTLIVPLSINKQLIGKMVLCKEVKDGFNKEMVNIIGTFARQACIAVENHRLLNQAIENERYQEELKIAKHVQKSLLPIALDHNDSFEICAFSNAADEVGGDYYDTFQLDENRFVLIIGDVSGKGTSAAFNMSQMKGIFHSLIQLDISPAEFIMKANSALGKCLEKNHFITASVFLIDTSKHEITYARAGHVPTLFYDADQGSSNYLKIDGLGLGILRNKQYEKHVEQKTFKYKAKDVLVLYTDGIIEAKNELSEQFGFDRLKNLVSTYQALSPQAIQDKIIDSLHEYVGEGRAIDDDYSIMVVKFVH